VIETPKNAAAIHTPPARRNAELPCGRFGSIEPPWPHADLKQSITKIGLSAQATSSATSFKQAIFGHLRES
jgi:hypothetical protein